MSMATLVRKDNAWAGERIYTVQRIVVPLDGTPVAEQAIAAALPLAHAFHTELLLVRANTIYSPARDSRQWIVSLGRHSARSQSRHQRQAIYDASLYLARIEQELRSKGIRVRSHVPLGPIPEAILEVANRSAADLIIISPHDNASGSAPLATWSTIRAMLHQTQLPVLLITSAPDWTLHTLMHRSPTATGNDQLYGADHTLPQLQPALRILLPLYALAASTLPHTTALARAFNGHVILQSISAVPVTPDPSATEHKITRYLTARGISVRTEPGQTLSIEEVACFARTHADIIVIGMPEDTTQREEPIQTALVVSRQSGIPLLIVPAYA